MIFSGMWGIGVDDGTGGIRGVRLAPDLVLEARAFTGPGAADLDAAFGSGLGEAALGAVLLADGLAGGRAAPLVAHLRLREASDRALDYVRPGTAAACGTGAAAGGAGPVSPPRPCP